MTNNKFWAAAIVALAATPAFAVYKCKDATGRLVFQERPCEATGTQGQQIEVRPAAGQGPTPSATASTLNSAPTGTLPQTEAQRLRALNERNSKESRLSKIEQIDIPSARARIRGATIRCDERMRAVRGQKAYAANNLAGATWEQSISTEMQAIATQCSAEQTRVNAELDRLLTEKRMIEQELGK